jgi:DNA-binding SARP family transcriptional activator
MAKLPAASGLLLLTWKWIDALIHNRTAEDWKASLTLVAEGLEIADRNGIHVWDQMLLAQGVYTSLNKRDLAMAEAFLKKMEKILDRHRRHGLYQYHYLAGWCCLLREDLSGALSHADSALRSANETGMYFAGILCNLLMAQVVHEKGEDGSVSLYLSTANELSRKSGSPMLEYMCLIKEAQFTLGQASGGIEKTKSEKQGLETLRRAMVLGREHGYVNLFPWWQPSAVANLCAKALAAGIEVDYVRNLVRKHRFFPDDPPLDIDNWPWPIRIATLGKFEIIREDKPLRFSGTVQKKPLLMLKVLIALGGTAVNVEQLSDLLWPDADGDQARTSFKVTLSRLRHQIGSEQALEVEEGKLTINPRYCWVDAWAFERISGQVAAFLKKSSLSTQDSKQTRENVAEATGWMEKVMGTYRAHFLLMEEEAWAISYRERLRGKFIDVIEKLGGYFQHTGQWQKAIACYEKAIEIDDLAEEVYQRLMLCYQRFDRVAKAISVYRRLVKTLSSVLGIEPSPRTESIYRELMGKFQVRNPSSSEKL